MAMGAVLSRMRFTEQGMPCPTEYLHREPSALLAMTEWEWKAQRDGAYVFPSHPQAEQAIPLHKELPQPGGVIFGPVAIACGAEAVEREREMVRLGLVPAGNASKAAKERKQAGGAHDHPEHDPAEVYRATALRMGEHDEER